FDPVHKEHIEYIKAAKDALSLDKVIVIPSHLAPHKETGAAASGEDRMNCCRLASAHLPYAEVSDFEVARKEKSYTFITAEHFAKVYAGDTLFFLVGADMLEDFFTWKNPERILACTTLAACGRGSDSAGETHARFTERFGKDYAEVPFTGAEVSSPEIRVRLAFGKETDALDPRVAEYINERGLYRHKAIAPALALEKEERVEHSFRVALLAAARARSLHIREDKAILAAALHDCGKYVPPGSPLLKGFTPPEDVPAPVLHQYTGAYIAEHELGVEDEEILDAIRYHTSGREDMTTLGKLIFLADMLESGRSFEGIEELRKAFWRDLDECLLLCFEHQNAYLEKNQNKGCIIYSLTKRAYKWLKDRQS
ncbi:MAG: nicotinate (nicotinamide) nucleotide adenylyltransferase, partial [Clostridiales bacterium]|nr:nicotinate (nicotinamide) nucleotide adenylyltransferase [Clostridiales bacterium]